MNTINKINLPQAAKLTSPNPVTVVSTKKPDGFSFVRQLDLQRFELVVGDK